MNKEMEIRINKWKAIGVDALLRECFQRERWEECLTAFDLKDIPTHVLREYCRSDVRAIIYEAVRKHKYRIAPPHQAAIPKDNGEFRIVYANELLDRIFLHIINQVLFDWCGVKMISKSCKSYQTGIGCGKVVKEVTTKFEAQTGKYIVAIKTDLSKYFDSVLIEYIDEAFDKIEKSTGKSVILDVLRDYYHSNACIDLEGNLIDKYQSLKQGCAVAAFLADCMLYDMDEYMASHSYYVRYSDDCLIVADDLEKNLEAMKGFLTEKGLTLNPKKVEFIKRTNWFKFLGFTIKGNMISLSKNRVKSFQELIEKATIGSKAKTVQQLIRNVHRAIYGGEYSFATSVITVINSERDIDILNGYAMDAIRVAYFNQNKSLKEKRKILGSLGCSMSGNIKDGVVVRGKRGTTLLRRYSEQMPWIGDREYFTIRCMRNHAIERRIVYDVIVLGM